jgi:hypothetical protein
VLLTIKGPADAQVTGVTGPAGSTCSIDGAQVLCFLPAGAVGSQRTDVRFGFVLPIGLAVGKSTVRGAISAAMPIDADPTPLDNSSKATFTIRYPKSAKAPSLKGAAHPRSGPTSFCGVAMRSSTRATGAWCVYQIVSARNGGKWHNGSISAKLTTGTANLTNATRKRQLEIDVQLQVRASTAYGGTTWTNVQDLTFRGGNFWVAHNPGLGNSPYISWARSYVGTKYSGWVHDRFSLLHDGALYRAQARFRYYESPVRGFFRKTGDSGWWTIRYQTSGTSTWGL